MDEDVGALGQLLPGVPAKTQGGRLHALGTPATNFIERELLGAQRTGDAKSGALAMGESGPRPTLRSDGRHAGPPEPPNRRSDGQSGRADGKITDKIASLHC